MSIESSAAAFPAAAASASVTVNGKAEERERAVRSERASKLTKEMERLGERQQGAVSFCAPPFPPLRVLLQSLDVFLGAIILGELVRLSRMSRQSRHPSLHILPLFCVSGMALVMCNRPTDYAGQLTFIAGVKGGEGSGGRAPSCSSFPVSEQPKGAWFLQFIMRVCRLAAQYLDEYLFFQTISADGNALNALHS